MKNGTVYWGLGSKRSVAKVYVKGDELEAGKGHGPKEDLPFFAESASLGG